MVRLVGVNIPDEQRLEHALTAIYGIGRARSKEILSLINISTDRHVKDLSDVELKSLQEEIEKMKVEGDLKEEINSNIKRLREIGTLRGIRHIRSLPVRGQRTRSNARTKRGKRKTIGALKKEDMLKLDQSKK